MTTLINYALLATTEWTELYPFLAGGALGILFYVAFRVLGEPSSPRQPR